MMNVGIMRTGILLTSFRIVIRREYRISTARIAASVVLTTDILLTDVERLFKTKPK